MRTSDRDAPVASHRAPLVNRIVVGLLGSRMRHLAGEKLAALRYTARSGASVVVPVQAARNGGEVVVLSGNAANKQWWRHFRGGASVELLLDGAWHAATGRVVTGADGDVVATYLRAFPRARIAADATLVVVVLDVR